MGCLRKSTVTRSKFYKLTFLRHVCVNMCLKTESVVLNPYSKIHWPINRSSPLLSTDFCEKTTWGLFLDLMLKHSDRTRLKLPNQPLNHESAGHMLSFVITQILFFPWKVAKPFWGWCFISIHDSFIDRHKSITF